MIEQTIIREKCDELYTEYLDRHIDDFDVFILSRVVEYFINSSQETVDNIVDVVEKTLVSRDNNKSDELVCTDTTKDNNEPLYDNSSLEAAANTDDDEREES